MDQESSAHPGSFQARGMALIELNKLKTLWYPLSVIAVLRHSVGESALAIACQVDHKTARRWLTVLAERGFLTRDRSINGYFLTPMAEYVIREILPTIRENLPISSPTTTTDSHLIIKKDRESVVVVVDPQNRENLPISREFLPICQDPISEETFSALRSCGIGEPKRSALARLSWVTPDFINKWKSHLRGRGKLDTGLLIHCLEGGDLPREPEPEEESVFDQVLKSDTPHLFVIKPKD